jgi:hypothetical protein
MPSFFVFPHCFSSDRDSACFHIYIIYLAYKRVRVRYNMPSAAASDSRYRPVRRTHRFWPARLDDDDCTLPAEEGSDAALGGDGTFLVAHSSLAAQVAATERRRREEGWNDLGLLDLSSWQITSQRPPASQTAPNTTSSTSGNEEADATAA